MKFSDPFTLHGQHVQLEPLSLAHEAEAQEAVCDGELWQLWYANVPRPEAMRGEIERRLELQAKGEMAPFAVRDGSGRFAGMTTYMSIDAANRRVQIGSTWYRQSAQRTPLNTECKLLLLRHAFEALACIAVEFRTHFFNQQSRTAIARLGAKQDGILRSHLINRHPDAAGSLRDTVVFSIIAAEWPAVQAHLQYRLQRRE